MDSVIDFNNPNFDQSSEQMQVAWPKISAKRQKLEQTTTWYTCNITRYDYQRRQQQIHNELNEIINELVEIIRFPLTSGLVDQHCNTVREKLLQLFQLDIKQNEQMLASVSTNTFSPKVRLHFKSTIKEEIKLRLGVDDIHDKSCSCCACIKSCSPVNRLDNCVISPTTIIWHPPLSWHPWIFSYLPLNDYTTFFIIFETLQEIELNRLKQENMRHHNLIEKSHKRSQCELSNFLSNIGLPHLYSLFDKQGYIPKVISGIKNDMLPKYGLKAGERSRILKAAEKYKAPSKNDQLDQILKQKQHKIEQYEEIFNAMAEVTGLRIGPLDNHDKVMETIRHLNLLPNNHTKYRCLTCNTETPMICIHPTGKDCASKSTLTNPNDPKKNKIKSPQVQRRPSGNTSSSKKHHEPQTDKIVAAYQLGQRNSITTEKK